MKLLKGLIFSLFAASLIVLSAETVQAKSYSISSVDISVTVNTDGSAQISELRKYDFNGSFTWADMWISLQAPCQGCAEYSVSNIAVFEGDTAYVENNSSSPGTFSISKKDSELYIKWFYSAQDEIKNFQVRYTLENAVTLHQDIAEFYWKAIGEGWSVPSQNVSVTVSLPSDAQSDRIFAFGHGPLDGIVSIPDRKTALFQVDQLDSETFFEVRFLFPKDIVNSGNSGSSTLDSILQEESSFATETRRNAAITRFISLAIFSLPFGVTLLIVTRGLFWIWKWYKIGNDVALPPVNLSGKLHEPPSHLEPALVESFTKWTQVPTSKSIIATLIEIARKKAISIESQKSRGLFGTKKKFIMRYTPASMKENLTELEHKLIDFLFHGTRELSFDEIRSYNKKHPSRTQTFWKSWQKEIQSRLVEEGLITKESVEAHKRLDGEMKIYIVMGSISVFLILILIPLESQISPLMIFLSIGLVAVSTIFAFVFSVLKFALIKRTAKGDTVLAEWRAFKKFLKDYSVTKRYPIDSVVLWERYLVYGAALGISAKALSQLPVQFDKAFESSGVYAFASAGSSTGGLEGLSSSFSTVTSAMNSSFGASGSGSSGSFSGGGGGGGGGGGAG